MRNLEDHLDKSDFKQPMQWKQLQANEIQKPLQFELSKEDFNLLIKDVANSLEDESHKTSLNNHGYDLKNAEKCLLKVTTKKISKNEARNLHDDLM